jgi:hypothetical protein
MVVLHQVFDFLKASKYFKTLFALQEETGQLAFDLEDDLAHVYSLVSKGDFSQLSLIIQNFKETNAEVFKEATFHVKTQELLEKINGFQEDLENIRENVRDLAAVSERSHLSSLLDAVKKGDLREFACWEVWKGRMNCWENLLEIFNGKNEVEDEIDVELTESEGYSDRYEQDDNVVYESDE